MGLTYKDCLPDVPAIGILYFTAFMMENKSQDLFLYNTKGIDKIKPLFSERYTF